MDFELNGDVDQYQEADSQTEEKTEDPELELEAIKARLKEMEEETEKIKRMHMEEEKSTGFCSAGGFGKTLEEKIEIDARSVYVGNVDYGATEEEIKQHFYGSGPINRVTIQRDRFTGNPKGFAYIEFATKDSVNLAVALNESMFRGRPIKVFLKRTNKPGISSTDRRPFRGRSFRFRRTPRVPNRGGYHPMRSSRGRSRAYPY